MIISPCKEDTIMDELTNYLQTLDSGPVELSAHLERLLAKVWYDLGGDQEGMAGHKLIGRMEQVVWNPPLLTFLIERHGRTVMGSTRAELQRWTVDLHHQTASCESTGHRQLSPMAKRVDVRPIADEVADKIVSGEADDRVHRLGDGRVRIEIGKVFPKRSGFKQTVQRRRRRLRETLIERLRPNGWVHLGRSMFSRTGLP
jgi:hypothetical protein